MSLDLLIALFGFAFVSSITPGPNNLMVMASGANFGVKRTLPHFFGVVVGFNFMIWMVGAGLMQVVERAPASFLVLKILSVVFLLYLAFKIATAAPPDENAATTGKPLGFFQAAAFQWVNPKAWALSVAAISAYAVAGAPLLSIAAVAGVFILAGAPSIILWLILGTQIRRFLIDPSHLRAFNWTCAALLAASIWPIVSALNH
ncbi:MAG TPA: LysE family translocator [Parvularculaceae bacterium]|nr:LysE family translocator [Parvularculaceae bacterium]HNS85361.1 LysE family translocator [Parvularculaceae bacterium]